MKKIITLCLVAPIMLSSCLAYEHSRKKDEEKMVLGMIAPGDVPNIKTEIPSTNLLKMNTLVAPAAGVAAVGAVAGTLAKIAAGVLEKEGEKYLSDYGHYMSFSDFYTGANFTYAGFTFKRTVDATPKTALAMNVQFEQSADRSAFRLKVSELNLAFSRCKINAKKEIKSIDVKIRVAIQATWTDDSGPHNTIIGNDEFDIAKLGFGKTLTPTDAVGKWIPNIPKTGANGTGNFTIIISVIESDDYGKRYTKIAKFLDSRADDFKDIIEKATAKED